MARRHEAYALPRRRLFALVMVITIIFGLIALRFAPHSGAPSVPAGARAGDLTLHACTYPTEAGGLAAECGSLVVAENRSRPDSRLIALPVTRLRARSGSVAEPVFFLSGGPGHTNMRFPQADRFTNGRDVVILGYRGIDGSTRLDCPEVERMHRHTADVLDERSFRAYDEAYRTCADRLKAAGIDVSAYGPVQQADDVESARAALGYGRIDVLSESAGTRTALIYAWRYPQNLHRSVMVGANPPGHFMWDPQTADEQLDRYSALCAEDPRCRTRTGDLAATMRRTSAALPKHWLFLPIKPSNARLVAWFALGETTSKAGPASAPAMIDTWLAAAEGDPSGLWLASVLGDLMFPELFVWGQSAAVGTTDAWAAGQYFATHGRQEAANFGYAMTAFAWGGGRLAGAWPAAAEADHYQDMRPSEVETLLISGSLDFETPPQNATKDLLPFLPNGHQVVLSGIGHAASFFVDQPEAGTRLITTFFDSGRVDTSLYTAQRTDFKPQLTFTKLAKYVFGTMLAVIALASLSLFAMAVRLRWRGRFSVKTSAVLRSVLPVVWGLGGWFGGALIVLATWPSVPLDDQRLVIIATSVPIGTGITLAWLDAGKRRTRQAIGGVAAFSGGLCGAWLGVQSAAGLLSVPTAIAMAAVFANLALIGFDMAADWRVAAETTPEQGGPAGSNRPTVRRHAATTR